MQTAQTFRPARRIPADKLAKLRAAHAAKKAAKAAEAQAREDAAQQLVAPTPEFAPAPRLTALPGGLHWSAPVAVPAIGATVTVQYSGHPAVVKVTAYCHAAGFLGLVTEPQQPEPPKRAARKAHPRAHCVFGSQLAQAA